MIATKIETRMQRDDDPDKDQDEDLLGALGCESRLYVLV